MEKLPSLVVAEEALCSGFVSVSDAAELLSSELDLDLLGDSSNTLFSRDLGFEMLF